MADCNGTSGLSLLIQSLIIGKKRGQEMTYLFHFQSNKQFAMQKKVKEVQPTVFEKNSRQI